MIFDKKEFKKYKRGQLDSDSVTVSKTSCPKCSTVIAFSQVWTTEIRIGVMKLPAQDDEGYVLGECSNCAYQFSIPVINPDYSGFSEGASLIGYIFESDKSDDSIRRLAELPTLTQALDRELDMNRRSYAYEYAGRALYECRKCGAGMDDLVLRELKAKFKSITSEYSKYLSWSLKNGRGLPPEYIFVRMLFNCSCGSDCIAFLSKPYMEDLQLNECDFSICNIIGAKPISSTIRPGVYSKSQIMQWLHKLLSRWTVLFDRIYVITPFVGHQWMKDQDLVDTWLELINRADPSKVKLITRKGQLTAFKRAYQAIKGIDYSLLEKLNLASRLLDEVVPDSKFHAKIYGAVSMSGCEVLSGSANLLSGPSKEVMHFTEQESIFEFNDAFIEPLGLNFNEDVIEIEKRYSLLFDETENFNTFCATSTIQSCEYRDLMLLDQLPIRTL